MCKVQVRHSAETPDIGMQNTEHRTQNAGEDQATDPAFPLDIGRWTDRYALRT